jgi:hypothetical protein
MDFRPGRAKVRLGKQEKVKPQSSPPVDPTAEAITGAFVRACQDGRIKFEILPTNQPQPQVQPPQPPVVVVNGNGQQQSSEPVVEEDEPEPILPEPPEDSFFNKVRGKR